MDEKKNFFCNYKLIQTLAVRCVCNDRCWTFRAILIMCLTWC